VLASGKFFQAKIIFASNPIFGVGHLRQKYWVSLKKTTLAERLKQPYFNVRTSLKKLGIDKRSGLFCVSIIDVEKKVL
jgi:hypothetical protein